MPLTEPLEESELPPPPPTPYEAIMGFVGWITCRRESVTIGSGHECSRIAELVGAYCDFNGLDNTGDPFRGDSPLRPPPEDYGRIRRRHVRQPDGAIREDEDVSHGSGHDGGTTGDGGPDRGPEEVDSVPG